MTAFANKFRKQQVAKQAATQAQREQRLANQKANVAANIARSSTPEAKQIAQQKRAAFLQSKQQATPQAPKQEAAPTTQPQQFDSLKDSLFKAAPAPQKQAAPTTQPQQSGLSAVKQSLSQQQAQFDKNMEQAAARPVAERAQFAQQFQKAAARKDPSTVRPGTTMGRSGISARVKPPALGATAKTATPSVLRRGRRPSNFNPASNSQFGDGGGGDFKKGGSVSARADGIAIKGKTRGRMV